ncbi:hypothetical protein [Bacillus tropicus]|uniref:hypothetical protein n=1 Tax=Bacillus tropicus TaxID=2026188 RepID=UPI00381F66D6
MKRTWNKEGLLSGIGGGILGSILMATIIIVFSKFDEKVITNVVTLIAGLGGGIISGLLTWLGVKYTINEQKRKERKDSITLKILSLHNLREIINECHDSVIDLKIAVKNLELSKKLEDFQEQVQKFDKTRQELEPKLITESLKINSEVYKVTIQCVEMMRSYSFSARVNSLDCSPSDIPEKKEEIVNLLSDSYGLLVKRIDKLDKTVSEELLELEKEFFN